MALNWSKDASFLQNGEQVILATAEGFIRVPAIYYNILTEIIKHRIDKASVPDCFDDEEDKGILRTM